MPANSHLSKDVADRIRIIRDELATLDKLLDDYQVSAPCIAESLRMTFVQAELTPAHTALKSALALSKRTLAKYASILGTEVSNGRAC